MIHNYRLKIQSFHINRHYYITVQINKKIFHNKIFLFYITDSVRKKRKKFVIKSRKMFCRQLDYFFRKINKFGFCA